MADISTFGYYWLDTWVMANIIQLATQDFCLQHLNRSNDPCGRQFDQMTQAARSVSAIFISFILLDLFQPFLYNGEYGQ